MIKKILIIDDDVDILDAMQAILSHEGYEVEVSDDGDILAKFKDRALPDLILLDLLMPGFDGLELCKSIKEKKSTSQIPIIIFSAHPTAAATVKKYGANDFIAKPFDLSSLLTKIRQFD